jgi:histidyl-tRNA synthetase
MSSRALPGFRDFYPAELAERSFIFDTWRSVARRFGFVEYDGPPLEPLELYTQKSGEEIVGQLYTFEDKGGRAVSLRPEMTPTLARMVAARANALRKPVRWFSIPQLFRYERQQRGRLREHFQLNLDIIGEGDVTADAELLAAAIEMMRAFGLHPDDVRARVSDRRLLTAVLGSVGVAEEQLSEVFAAVDKVDRMPAADFHAQLLRAGVGEPLSRRVRELVTASNLEALESEFGADEAVRVHLDRMREHLAHLDALGVGEWVDLNLKIVRGLAYYTGIVFELFDEKGEFRAIAGGGRYDNLLKALGGVDLPALGFGMGDVVLGELLRDRGLMPTEHHALDYWVARDDAAPLALVMRVAAALRGRGMRVEYPLRAQKLDKQMKAAAGAGAQKVLIVRGESAAVVRRLADGAQHEVSLALLLAAAPPPYRDGRPWMGTAPEDPFPFPYEEPTGSETEHAR